MRTFEFKFQPQSVKINTEEILADLTYPASAQDRPDGRKPARRPRTRK